MSARSRRLSVLDTMPEGWVVDARVPRHRLRPSRTRTKWRAATPGQRQQLRPELPPGAASAGRQPRPRRRVVAQDLRLRAAGARLGPAEPKAVGADSGGP